MKRLPIFIILSMVTVMRLYCQYDKNWMMGSAIIANVNFYNIPINVDSLFNDSKPYGVRSLSSITNFRQDSIFFYSNGVFIGNRFGNKLLNSEYTVDSLYYDYHYSAGSTSWQCSMMLPKTDSSFYSINQSESDSIFNIGIEQPDRLYYSVINMNGDNNQGSVSQKRLPILEGIMGEGRLTACRHANGRDWWIIQTGCNNNQYHIILCTPDSIAVVKTQAIGQPYNQPDSQGQAVFSPDGTKYALGTTTSHVQIFDFDRCTGILSNNKLVKFPFRQAHNSTYKATGSMGLAFSPDSKNLYGNTLYTIFQISNYTDTLTPALKIIGEWDSTFTEYYPFEQANLIPNGKIIIGTYTGGTHAYHLIDSPDNTANPAFIYKGFDIPFLISARSVSNMPNYRLGKIEGSACDTIVAGIKEVNSNASIKLYPNPASSYVNISLMEYGADAQLTITDITGKVVHQQGMYLDAQVDVSRWVSGMYIVRIESRGKQPVVGRFVRE